MDGIRRYLTEKDGYDLINGIHLLAQMGDHIHSLSSSGVRGSQLDTCHLLLSVTVLSQFERYLARGPLIQTD